MLSQRTQTTSALQLLQWDSHFFGYTIGRIDVLTYDEGELETLLEKARRQGVKLLYVFTNGNTMLSTPFVSRHAGYLIDTKRTYGFDIHHTETEATDSAIRACVPKQDVSALYALAYQSGAYSRFRMDPAFGEENFERLYRQWIDNSLANQIASATFVYETGASIRGFITVQQKTPVATIGLMATDPGARRQGIGRALLNHVKNQLCASSSVRLDVITQVKNEPACRFYERNGFVVQHEVNVYHFWL